MSSSTILPILGRELRVAARKRSTFWLRTVAALVFFVIGTGAVVLIRAFKIPTAMGEVLFSVLTWLSFVAALSAGVFFTADSLSEEKREGTLGLLFLTDLRGYDVATGKLTAAWLRCFYALLAVFPVLAVTLMLGGVTGAQFYKTMLALVNTLFCSLAAGLFVSVLSRDSQKAMAAAFGLLSLLAYGGPTADSVFLDASRRTPNSFFALSSPLCAFEEAGAWGANHFWRALAISSGVGWFLLAATCALVPRTWQERRVRPKGVVDRLSRAWAHGGRRWRARLRRKLLERNPVAWLCCRLRSQSFVPWSIALFVVGANALVYGRHGPTGLAVMSFFGWYVLALFYLFVAMQACRFLVETRRSGVLELLLTTPAEPSAIVRGNWQALLRIFALPVCVILATQGVAGFVTQYHTFSTLASVSLPPNAMATTTNNSGGVVSGPSRNAAPRGTNSQSSASAATQTGAVSYSINTGPSSTTVASGTNSAKVYTYNSYSAMVSTAWNPQAAALAAAYTLIGTATTAANLIAIAWFGLWMGMTSRNSPLATLKTLGLVQVAPLLVIWFTTGILIFGLMMSQFTTGRNQAAKWTTSIAEWIPLIMASLVFIFSLVKDIAFSAWARGKLRSSFRQVASQATGVPLQHIQPSTVTPPKIPGA
jgi:ABC-type transport system involved in multi-copper enzyme maturation permease subunit